MVSAMSGLCWSMSGTSVRPHRRAAASMRGRRSLGSVAPVVKAPLTGGKVAFAFGTAAEAEKVATELGASPTS